MESVKAIKLLALPILAAAMLAAAGCGGGSPASPGATPAVTPIEAATSPQAGAWTDQDQFVVDLMATARQTLSKAPGTLAACGTDPSCLRRTLGDLRLRARGFDRRLANASRGPAGANLSPCVVMVVRTVRDALSGIETLAGDAGDFEASDDVSHAHLLDADNQVVQASAARIKASVAACPGAEQINW